MGYYLDDKLGLDDKREILKQLKQKQIELSVDENTKQLVNNVFEKAIKELSNETSIKRLPNESQVNFMIRVIQAEILHNHIILFHDQMGDPFVRLKEDNLYKIYPLKSREFKKWIRKTYYELENSNINNNSINEVINAADSRIRTTYNLYNRVAWYDNSIWYDLGDWRAIRINKEGWEIVEHPPILFKKYKHQLTQIEPIKSDFNILEMDNFLNMNKDNQFLYIINLICCFIPNIPHPVFGIYGEKGTAKSTNCRVVKKIVDPSATEILSIPKDKNELIQIFDHNYFPLFDNITYLSQEVSDMLCRAITGDGISKRMLYSDSDDIIYSYQRCMAINGIQVAGSRPDLLDRTIQLETEYITNEKRKTEKEFWDEFELKKAEILGAIFTILSKAMSLYPPELKTLNRMADFTQWGYCISKTINQEEKFLKLYSKNIKSQNEEVLSSNIIVKLILLLNKREIKGNPTDILQQLRDKAIQENINVDEDKNFPKAANILIRKLNEIKGALRSIGIEYSMERTAFEKMITITNKSADDWEH